MTRTYTLLSSWQSPGRYSYGIAAEDLLQVLLADKKDLIKCEGLL